MLPSQLLNPKWATGLTLALLLSAFSLPVSAVVKNENNRRVDAEWTLRQDSAIPELGRLAQAQPTQDRRAEAFRLTQEGLQHHRRGQFQEAIEYYQQSLAILQEIRDRVGEGTILNNMGDIYRRLGQYPEAIRSLQQSLAIHIETGNRSGESTALNNLGSIYDNRGQYQEAIEYYQQSLAILREVGNLVKEGKTLSNLGWVYANLGQYPEAIEYYQQSLAIFREVGDRKGERTTLDNLSLIYVSQGPYQKAVEYYKESLAIDRETGDRVGEGVTLSYLGNIYRNQGKYAEAIEYYQKALAIHQEVGNRELEGEIVSNLGGVYKDRGQYQEAIEYYQQALAIHQEVGNRAVQGITLNNLTGVYWHLGQYSKAIENYQRALAIHQEVGNRTAEGDTLNNLGNIYSSLGKYQEAIESYEQSLAITRETGNRGKEGLYLQNLGAVYLKLEQYQEAIKYIQKALAIHQEVGNRAGKGLSLNNLGAVYGNLGQHKEAIKYYQQALAIRREVGDRAGEGLSLNNLGTVYFNQKQYADAEANLYAAIDVLDSLRTPELADADKISLFETQAHTYRLLQHTLIAQKKTDRALEISERGRARAFVELLAKQLNPQSNELPNIDPPSIEEIKQIAKAQNATLVQYSVLSNSLLIWVIQPTGKIDFRTVDLQKLDGSLANITELARIEAANPRSSGSGDEFTSLIRSTQESLRTDSPATSGDSADKPLKRLRQLHQLLIAPIADLLPANPENRVIFIPHQSLFYVPFPALQDEEFNYLIEKHTILTAPSIQVLQLTRKHRQRLTIPSSLEDRALIVGNPTMPWIPDEEGDLFQLSNLSGAEREATEIAQMLNVETLLGANATETTVSQRMKTARLIHFATHGLLDDFGYGIPGAIALAPSGNRTEGRSIFGDPNDGLLTSGEIVTMTQNNPLNAELVVLSACETGLGDLSGDGIIGLSRSLITAGVPSIVVSLWKVPDVETRELMTEFYTNRYLKNMDKAQALRQAMLTVIEGDSPDPSAWAAFTLIGEAE
ncbi:tetratricopeptide repeat protein [Lusitaniella coriacea LEGE 07157]|uniref:Tetratricopeptide repeat protein n=1 Tax=Lusitaniella coriacea LEGE 07157 TaxID=945747 RepID=A0A8J7DT37_9CYAN|nr:tetratricopeptide repeat protein [Lusitaniella coriacea]MBE9115267.1 tetratricopeptide repeat protein [Lusitaniella coriacea LEGE 07157]